MTKYIISSLSFMAGIPLLGMQQGPNSTRIVIARSDLLTTQRKVGIVTAVSVERLKLPVNSPSAVPISDRGRIESVSSDSSVSTVMPSPSPVQSPEQWADSVLSDNSSSTPETPKLTPVLAWPMIDLLGVSPQKKHFNK